MKVFTIFILLLYLLTGCRKDSQIPLQPYSTDCSANGFDSVPKHNGGIRIDPSIYFDSLYIRFPYFNPNNSDEIIYYMTYKQELIKYNMVTKTKQSIFKGLLLNRPKWSKKGWILLPSGGGQIWKIKDDGTQLTQLTYGSIGHYAAEWNIEGTKFGCQAVNVGHSYGAMYDEFGIILDSFQYPLTGCWQNANNKPIGASGYSIGYTDLKTDSKVTLYSLPNDDFAFHGAYWMADGINAAVIADNGVYSFNTQTKKLTFLKQICSRSSYYSLCVSHISGKLIMEKPTTHYIGHNSILTRTKLVIMNADGSGEQEIEL